MSSIEVVLTSIFEYKAVSITLLKMEILLFYENSHSWHFQLSNGWEWVY